MTLGLGTTYSNLLYSRHIQYICLPLAPHSTQELTHYLPMLLALGTTYSNLLYSRYIQPICLPLGPHSTQDFTHYLPMALGWGTTYYDGQVQFIYLFLPFYLFFVIFYISRQLFTY